MIEEKKITAYLLNISHPDGRGKAKFFLSRGFSLGDIETFARRMLDHPISPTSVLTIRRRCFAACGNCETARATAAW